MPSILDQRCATAGNEENFQGSSMHVNVLQNKPLMMTVALLPVKPSLNS
jgi:hypothetical protein